MRGLFFLVGAVVAIGLGVAGCGDEAIDPAHTGTIEVVVVPAGAPGAWRLEGPGGYRRTGAGAAEIGGLATGDYTVTWEDLADWGRPYPGASTRNLAADEVVSFTGVWIPASEHDDGFIDVAAGSFAMGSPEDEPDRFAWETLHRVTLTRSFSIQVTEVISGDYAELAQWAWEGGLARLDGDTLKAVGSTAPLLRLTVDGSGIVVRDGKLVCEEPDRPVTFVTWNGAALYCNWRSVREGLPPAYDLETWRCHGGDPYGAAGYRLPTEAEWEYACRAGSREAFANGPITHTACEPLDTGLDALGWYCGNSDERRHRIAEKEPSGWGLYDMHGNVQEWCNDRLSEYESIAVDPAGPDSPSDSPVRVVRGGGWYYYARYCRSACRDYALPRHLSEHVGFRCVRTVADVP